MAITWTISTKEMLVVMSFEKSCRHICVIQSRLVGQSNYNVNFAVVFEVSNPATKKRVAGTATETEMLAPDASGNKKIISQHEKVTISHRSDGKP